MQPTVNDKSTSSKKKQASAKANETKEEVIFSANHKTGSANSAVTHDETAYSSSGSKSPSPTEPLEHSVELMSTKKSDSKASVGRQRSQLARSLLRLSNEEINFFTSEVVKSQSALAHGPQHKDLEPFVKFYQDQQHFLRSMEQCSSMAANQQTGSSGSGSEDSSEESSPILSEAQLLERQAALVRRQNALVDRTRSALRRSDSFEQLINVTVRGQQPSHPQTQLQANQSSPMDAASIQNVKFYIALAVIIGLILVVKLLN